jgi:hypothetical protein
MERKVAEILGGVALIAFVLILILGYVNFDSSRDGVVVTNNINVNSGYAGHSEKVYISEPRVVERPVYKERIIEKPIYIEKENPIYVQTERVVAKPNCFPKKVYVTPVDYQKTYRNGEVIYRKDPASNFYVRNSEQRQITWSKDGYESHVLPYSYSEIKKTYDYIY